MTARPHDRGDAAGRIAAARRILVITGAGVSAESGIPTFRDKGGWWKHYRPEDLATPDAFARDPHTVWSWYDARRQGVARAEPNAGHRALARAEAAGCRVAIVTQNVDDLHERAGSREIAHVAQPCDGVVHGKNRLFADPRSRVQDPVHCGKADPGFTSNVDDSRPQPDLRAFGPTIRRNLRYVNQVWRGRVVSW